MEEREENKAIRRSYEGWSYTDLVFSDSELRVQVGEILQTLKISKIYVKYTLDIRWAELNWTHEWHSHLVALGTYTAWYPRNVQNKPFKWWNFKVKKGQEMSVVFKTIRHNYKIRGCKRREMFSELGSWCANYSEASNVQGDGTSRAQRALPPPSLSSHNWAPRTSSTALNAENVQLGPGPPFFLLKTLAPGLDKTWHGQDLFSLDNTELELGKEPSSVSSHEALHHPAQNVKYTLFTSSNEGPTFINTNTKTGTKSSAPGTESSLARLSKFMIVEHILRMHCTLSRGVL